MISHNSPWFTEEEEQAVVDVLRSGWVAKGSKVSELESLFARYINNGKGTAVAVSSGSAALYLALKSLNLRKVSKVIVPTYACSALLNAVSLADCEPVVLDIEHDSLNIRYNLIKQAVQEDKIGAIIAVHTFGMPADIQRIKSLGVPVIEDCAQALGSKINNKPVGSFGDISIFSFYASKMINSGSGGLVYSENASYISAITDYINFDGVEDYIPRFNFDYNDILAAVAIEQFKKLDHYVTIRKRIADKYRAVGLEKGFVEFKTELSDCDQNYYRFVLNGSKDEIDKLRNYFANNDICTVIPIEQYELLHRYLKLENERYPVAENIVETSLSLPIFPRLVCDGSIERIVSVFENY